MRNMRLCPILLWCFGGALAGGNWYSLTVDEREECLDCVRATGMYPVRICY